MIRLLTRYSSRHDLSAGVRAGTASTAVPVPRLIGTITRTAAGSTSTRHVTDSPTTATARESTSDITGTDLKPTTGTADFSSSSSSSSTSASNADSSSAQLDLSEYMEQAKARFSSRFPEPRILFDTYYGRGPSHCLAVALSNHLPADCLPDPEVMLPRISFTAERVPHKDEPVQYVRFVDREHDLLPQGHHLLYFPPTGELMSDGAEKDLCPGAPFVRRLWLGGSLTFRRTLKVEYPGHLYCLEDVGSPTMSTNSLPGNETVSVQIKRYYFGHLKHLEICARSLQSGKGFRYNPPAIEETRKLLFCRQGQNVPLEDKEATKSTARRVGRPLFVPDNSFELTPDRNLLFQFSALTYNAHAIHLDPEYARNIEGYKGLLVHGPLTLVLMLSALRRECKIDSEATMLALGEEVPWATESIEYRNCGPLYAGQRMKVCVKLIKADRFTRKKPYVPTEKRWRLWIEDSEGRVAVRATAVTAAAVGARHQLVRPFHRPLTETVTPYAAKAAEPQYKEEAWPAASIESVEKLPQTPANLGRGNLSSAEPPRQHPAESNDAEAKVRLQLEELKMRQNEFSAKLQLMEMERQLMERQKELMQQEKELIEKEKEKEKQLVEKEKELLEKEKRLREKEKEEEMQLIEKDRELIVKEKRLIEKEMEGEELRQWIEMKEKEHSMRRAIRRQEVMKTRRKEEYRRQKEEEYWRQKEEEERKKEEEEKRKKEAEKRRKWREKMNKWKEVESVLISEAAATEGRTLDPWDGRQEESDPFQGLGQQMEASRTPASIPYRNGTSTQPFRKPRLNQYRWNEPQYPKRDVRGPGSSSRGNDMADDQFDRLQPEPILAPGSDPTNGSWAAQELDWDEDLTGDPFTTLLKKAAPSPTASEKKKSPARASWEEDEDQQTSQEKVDNFDFPDGNLAEGSSIDNSNDTRPSSAMETSGGGGEESERDWLHGVEDVLYEPDRPATRQESWNIQDDFAAELARWRERREAGEGGRVTMDKNTDKPEEKGKEEEVTLSIQEGIDGTLDKPEGKTEEVVTHKPEEKEEEVATPSLQEGVEKDDKKEE